MSRSTSRPEERPRALLLRAPDVPGPDRYVEALGAAGFAATCAPVLAFAFVNGHALRAALARPERYAGLVLTSPRAAEALRRVGVPGGWPGRPAFVVGHATRDAVADLGLQPVGAEAGNADALADLVLTRPLAAPLLFVCGDPRRDVLPTRLGEAGIAVEEVVAYETRLRAPDVDPRGVAWAVWFSPSGVEAVVDAVVSGEADPAAWNSPRRAAIGPTTAAALAAAGWPPHATATAPTPAALAAALQ